MNEQKYDVVILVADFYLTRSLRIGQVRYEVIIHEESDPGVFNNPTSSYGSTTKAEPKRSW
ncbi:MAG: hypothetical protein GXO39_08200 [Thermotogae bacterium]|nr:hypothetical protein [Thermotogota bacterium]